MTARIEVSSECGVVALGDGQARLPAGLDQKVLLRQLEPLARSAQIFFMVSDDPVRYRMDVMAEETLSPGLDREFEPLGGTFRLDVPNGRVALVGWDKVGEPREAGALSVRPGVYLLSVLTRRPFDGARHAEDMAKLLGADWKFMRIVDRLGLIGCLPLVLAAICLLAARWKWLWYVAPLLAVSWLPYLVLKYGRRYRVAERRASDAELARPHYVVSLVPTQREDLHGGYLRV